MRSSQQKKVIEINRKSKNKSEGIIHSTSAGKILYDRRPFYLANVVIEFITRTNSLNMPETEIGSTPFFLETISNLLQLH